MYHEQHSIKENDKKIIFYSNSGEKTVKNKAKLLTGDTEHKTKFSPGILVLTFKIKCLRLRNINKYCFYIYQIIGQDNLKRSLST